MCPKNMLILKSGKGDQICQTCLDLHHLHTIYRNFPGEDPRTPLCILGASRPRIRLASLGLCGPQTFSLSKSGPSKKHLVTPPPWYICYILQRKNTFINFFFFGGGGHLTRTRKLILGAPHHHQRLGPGPPTTLNRPWYHISYANREKLSTLVKLGL